MCYLVSFKGQVLTATKEVITLNVKDKDGKPTGQTKDHVIVKIQLLVTLADKSMRAVNVNGFDPAVDFVMPKPGETWETGEVRSYEVKNGFPTVNL